MPIKATIDGEVWEFSTAAEAAEFKRSLTAQAMPSQTTSSRHARKRGRPAKASAPAVRNNPRVPSANGAGLSDGSRQILEAIRRKSDGLQSEEFAHAIGSPRPRSVPPRMMMLAKELKTLGLKSEDVVQRSRIYVKSKARSVFKPGPRLEEALQRNGNLFGGK